jgi:pimeloyl-ACP methyl ester carboxylesterase
MLLLRWAFAVSAAVALFAPAVLAAEPAAAAVPSVFLRTPRDVAPGTPLQVLVALHGMGGTGDQIAGRVLAEAERNHWLLVAPTINYGDWTDPKQVAREDPLLIEWLANYIDRLPATLGVQVRPRVLLLGHSRGAQLAHRFALFQPQRVLAVAALAAGTYTLPLERSAEGNAIGFPFGVSDMTSVAGHSFSRTEFIEDTQFWLGVGSEDTNPNDLPRAWDEYLGTTRVQRAHVFQAALHQLGARSVLVAFRGERHVLSSDMAASACTFLRSTDLGQSEAHVLRPTHGRLAF